MNQMHWCPGNAHTKRRPASAGTLRKRGRGGPTAQVLTLFVTIDDRGHKTPTQSKRERTTGKKRLNGHGPGFTHCTRFHVFRSFSVPSITRPLLQWALSVAPDVCWVEFRCVERHGTEDADGSHRSHQSCHHGQDDDDRVVCNGKEL